MSLYSAKNKIPSKVLSKISINFDAEEGSVVDSGVDSEVDSKVDSDVHWEAGFDVDWETGSKVDWGIGCVTALWLTALKVNNKIRLE